MNRKIALILILMACCAGAYAADEAPRVHVHIDKDSIFIGDRIYYEIKTWPDRNTEVEFPKFGDGKIGDFEIKDSGNRNTSVWYSITAYTVGKRAIPPASVQYRKKGEKTWKAVETKKLDVTVKSIFPAGQVIKDIKDIKGPFYFYEFKWRLIIFLLAVIFCIASIVIYRQRVKRRKALKSPDEIALEELRMIQEALARHGDVKGYHVRISDCVRRYIESAFRIKAPEMTTEEFLSSLEDSRALSSDNKELLKDFLEACDLVKFAKYAPARKEIDAIYLKAKGFIEAKKI